MKREKGKIITVTSSKGGVGKTILLLNLAGIYSNLKKKVLILDFDFDSGSIALNLNLTVKKTIYQVADDIHNHRYLEYKDYISTYNDYIDVVSSIKDPRQATKIDIKDLNLFIDEVSHHYDVILIDTTHGLTKNNIFTLDFTDQILYVVSNDFMDLKNTKNFMAVMKSANFDNIKMVLNESFRPDLEYFNHFDIKSITKKNIDYTINSTFFIKNIAGYILDGKIYTLTASSNKHKKDIEKLNRMAKDLLEE